MNNPYINAKYAAINTNEYVLEIGCFTNANGINTIPKITIIGISNTIITDGLTIGLTILTIPITDKILNKFEPIILPTEMPCSL